MIIHLAQCKDKVKYRLLKIKINNNVKQNINNTGLRI